MSSGFTKNGTDLDSLFEPRTTSAIANTGFIVAGVDLAQRYEKLSSGSAIAATGFISGGSDLNTKFCGIGTAVPRVTLNVVCTAYDITAAGYPPGMTWWVAIGTYALITGHSYNFGVNMPDNADHSIWVTDNGVIAWNTTASGYDVASIDVTTGLLAAGHVYTVNFL